ncbi:RIP metalloprotease RseP [Sphingomonas ginkgonis]|uniref:Zinc metalloprotease n=1 Tax=Sphingomonas ginkgonis TaxID=2315330 RepID=A0A429VAS3_9SPHN|nr:RIP metalloprotease RseP [Sphingomonas ginkgonis]RST31079.1 RIP metalloprotease RseP [Sphingomonas ginkgonis]
MLPQPPVWFIAIAFIAALGPLVFFHELGHYLVARWFGIGAETFSIGFGREIAGWSDRRGTRWQIGWLPFGGYVKFTGDMDPASQGARKDLPPEVAVRSFHTKPWWQRFLVVLAGPMANFLLAILIVAGLFAIQGEPRTPPVVNMVQPGSAAAQAGFRPGDRIVAANGRGIDDFSQLSEFVMLRPGADVTIQFVRGGQTFSTTAHVRREVQRDRFGQTFQIGRLGIYATGRDYQRVSPLRLLPDAAGFTVRMTRSMVDGIWQIVTGRLSADQIGGPLKMAQIAGQQASLGLVDFVWLLALFSINLGFINLLPVPMLDGGHLAFYLAEAVRRRPVSERAQEWAFRGGFAALLTLLLFTTVNDLGSLGLWERLERLIG